MASLDFICNTSVFFLTTDGFAPLLLMRGGDASCVNTVQKPQVVPEVWKILQKPFQANVRVDSWGPCVAFWWCCRHDKNSVWNIFCTAELNVSSSSGKEVHSAFSGLVPSVLKGIESLHQCWKEKFEVLHTPTFDTWHTLSLQTEFPLEIAPLLQAASGISCRNPQMIVHGGAAFHIW